MLTARPVLTTAAVLRTAKAMLTRGRWAQGHRALDDTHCCSAQAIERAYNALAAEEGVHYQPTDAHPHAPQEEAALDLLIEAAHCPADGEPMRAVILWQDGLDVTLDAVHAAFDAAIEAASRLEAGSC